MAIKKILPRKHAGKKVTPAQEKEIKQVQDNMTKNRGDKPVAWLEAKQEYFEREERQITYLGSKKHQENLQTAGKLAEMQDNAKVVLQRSAVPTRILGAGVNDKKKKRSTLTIAEAKLGVTMVMDAEDCKAIGIPDTTLTSEAINIVRKKLGLSTRAERRKSK